MNTACIAVLTKCMKLKDNESCLIITDAEREPIGKGKSGLGVLIIFKFQTFDNAPSRINDHLIIVGFNHNIFRRKRWLYQGLRGKQK